MQSVLTRQSKPFRLQGEAVQSDEHNLTQYLLDEEICFSIIKNISRGKGGLSDYSGNDWFIAIANQTASYLYKIKCSKGKYIFRKRLNYNKVYDMYEVSLSDTEVATFNSYRSTHFTLLQKNNDGSIYELNSQSFKELYKSIYGN